MALFQRNPHSTSKTAPLYSIGLQKSVIIVGLGNIGKDYNLTRHNIGFVCLDHLHESLGLPAWIDKKDLKATVSVGVAGDKRIILVKPRTMMNLSGESVQAVAHFYKVSDYDTVVVHDELDIPFGQIRTRTGGGSAGHNGIKSVSQHLGENYRRVRIGVGKASDQDAADFVLGKFSKEEQAQLPALTKEVTALLTEYVYGSEFLSETRNFIS